MSSSLRVLVAHYDAAHRERLEALLEAEGATVRTCARGQECLEVAAEFSPHVALISTLLPELSGFEVCRRLTPSNTDLAVSVVLLTDVEDPYVRARARHCGADRVVHEPLDDLTLREILEPASIGVEPVDSASAVASTSDPGTALLDRLLHDREEPQDTNLLARLSDPLTGLLSSDYMQLKVDEEAKRADRYKAPISLLVASIDNYADICATHSQEAGDEAMLEVAGVFLCESRDVDIAGRGEGAQFLLLMPNTLAEGAQAAAARIQSSLAERRLLLDQQEVDLVISLGLVSFQGGQQKVTRELLLRAAADDQESARTRTLS